MDIRYIVLSELSEDGPVAVVPTLADAEEMVLACVEEDCYMEFLTCIDPTQGDLHYTAESYFAESRRWLKSYNERKDYYPYHTYQFQTLEGYLLHREAYTIHEVVVL